MEGWGSPKKSPVIEFGGGKLLINPSLRELAQGAGVWRHCPEEMSIWPLSAPGRRG